jgi:hypothetical protein
MEENMTESDIREMKERIAKLSGKALVLGQYDNQGNFVMTSPADLTKVDLNVQYRSDTYLIDNNGVPDTYNFENSKILRRILPSVVGTLPSILSDLDKRGVFLEEVGFLRVRATPLVPILKLNDFEVRTQ